MNLRWGQEWLNEVMAADVAGVTVTYMQGDIVAELAAEYGRTAFRQQSPSPGGAGLIWGDRDYLITVAAFAAVGITEPQDAALIVEVIDGQECVFKVMRPDTGEPAVRYSDNTRTKWRIHCKQVPKDE